ncbi:WD40 repeat-like protein [Trichodelitschia bisporula]|uniref:WD40 repeat-like protein n=1 Tax=Trichodelitschia bisporula TaxID=703511 RepID=A0A6G1I3H6_9PEZI|nr:WD40 repeat-like protein [Trichodelitschia bisporula]
MKAAPLLVQWHNEGTPIFSAHFEPHGKGRLATAGGDSNVRIWKIDPHGEDRKVTYLSTLVRHSQTVNVVRWCPRGEMIASAGDDGNVLLWVPAEHHEHAAFGEDGTEDKETWRVKHMCRSMGTEIYDLAWSPDGQFFITGSMDNIAKIYNAQTGSCVRQIAEHNHFVQGVAWDPLNEYIATQSSDRSVHIYTLKTKEGHFSLAQHNKVSRMDIPTRRISSSSPAPPDFSGRASFIADPTSHSIGSPVPSAPGTPQSLALPMNPPPTSHSRRSSFGSSRRSVSPAPSLPLPAVMPSSPNPYAALHLKNERIYAGEDTFSSFFRRLTFTPEGSLLFTPAGQYRAPQGCASKDEIVNTVYIYTRSGLNKPPIAFLPGHKKPSVAVRCSPIFYTHRAAVPTKHITIDTSAPDVEISSLSEPAMQAKPQPSAMEPPPLSAPSPAASIAAASPKPEADGATTPATPPAAFGLAYRMVYAVATMDAVHVYDTQQQKPLCVVSNLHYANFTDLTWSNDGLTLLMSSSDGFCSALAFAPGELGQVHHGPIPTRQQPGAINTTVSSQATTPNATPVAANPPQLTKQPSASFPASPSKFAPVRPVSPARSMSNSSAASSFPPDSVIHGNVLMHSTPSMQSVPGVAAAHSAPVPGNVPLWTPPETPMFSAGASTGAPRTHSASSSVSGITGLTPAAPKAADDAKDTDKKRANEDGEEQAGKRRRVAPTPVEDKA